MSSKCKRYRYVNSLEDMQKIFDIANQRGLVVCSDKPYEHIPGQASMKAYSIVNDGDRYYKITTMYVKDIVDEEGNVRYVDIITEGESKYVCTWIFDKTGENATKIHPSRVSAIVSHVYKPKNIIKESPDLFQRDDKGKFIQSARPTIGYNEKYNNTEHYAVSYDLNSAYAAVLVDKIIDTYHCRIFDTVHKGEVGFVFNNTLDLRYEGESADFIFPLIDSPYKQFAKKYYDLKKTAKPGSDEKALAKQILVIAVGLMQNTNPFLRAYIVNTCNAVIDRLRLKYKDKVCMWNTDSIVCTERIPELESLCGDGIGQFKRDYEGLFRQRCCNYQKVGESTTSYRGVMKCLFKKDFNILTDNTPKIVLPYKMNKQTLRIEMNKEFVNGKKV